MKKQEAKRIYARHNLLFKLRKNLANKNGTRGITLIALVITIVLNCSYLAMERMIEKEPNILKI